MCLNLDRDFYQFGQKDRPSLREASAFQQPIEQLPPGAEMIFGLVQGFVVLGDDADKSVTPPVFSIDATYSYGKRTVSERTTIDLRPYKESMDPPSAIVDELKKIREQLQIIAKKRLRSNSNPLSNIRPPDGQEFGAPRSRWS